MSSKELIDIIKNIIEEEMSLEENSPLVGGNSLIDSMNLVQICIALEDKSLEDGFEFDWTSDAAMSKSRSMFRSVSALAEEFANQSEA